MEVMNETYLRNLFLVIDDNDELELELERVVPLTLTLSVGMEN